MNTLLPCVLLCALLSVDMNATAQVKFQVGPSKRMHKHDSNSIQSEQCASIGDSGKFIINKSLDASCYMYSMIPQSYIQTKDSMTVKGVVVGEMGSIIYPPYDDNIKGVPGVTVYYGEEKSWGIFSAIKLLATSDSSGRISFTFNPSMDYYLMLAKGNSVSSNCTSYNCYSMACRMIIFYPGAKK